MAEGEGAGIDGDSQGETQEYGERQKSQSGQNRKKNTAAGGNGAEANRIVRRHGGKFASVAPGGRRRAAESAGMNASDGATGKESNKEQAQTAGSR